MLFYRVFPFVAGSRERDPGGPLYIPRKNQGSQRHDIPHLDGVLYCSRVALSAVTEVVSHFSGTSISNTDLKTASGANLALVEYELDDKIKLLDLNAPETLVEYKISPSEIVTKVYSETRKLSERIWRAEATGFLWPSSHEGSWINATLFESRIKKHLHAPHKNIQVLTVEHPEVRDACARLRIPLHK